MSKTALIAGGTSGIGAAVAAAFAAEGYRTIAAGLPGAAPQHCETRLLDVASNDQVQSLMRSLDQLDVLVNCAGIIRRDDEFDLAVFEQVLDVNLTGTMRLCVAAHSLLLESRGAIVNVASMLSFFGGPRVPAYSASKGGVAQLTRSLAVAWAKDGIRVNAIAPGWIATPFTDALQKDADRSNVILGRTPMARWGTPSDLCGPVLFLCSPAASFITGAILPVDGGYSAA